MNHFNLDMIVAVGYRVNSVQAVQFRIWVTRTPILKYQTPKVRMDLSACLW